MVVTLFNKLKTVFTAVAFTAIMQVTGEFMQAEQIIREASPLDQSLMQVLLSAAIKFFQYVHRQLIMSIT